MSGFYSLVRPLIRLTRGIGSLTAVFAKLIDDHAGEWGSRFTDRCPKSKRCATLGANEGEVSSLVHGNEKSGDRKHI